jgi:hypothetical protein
MPPNEGDGMLERRRNVRWEELRRCADCWELEATYLGASIMKVREDGIVVAAYAWWITQPARAILPGCAQKLSWPVAGRIEE